MRIEIKQRIEQIRRGEVPDGYKKMKNNILPSDWYKTALEETVKFLDEKRIPIKENERVAGNYPYYGASGIIDYVHDYIFDGEYILLGEDGANIIDRSSPLAFKVSGKCWVNNHAHVLEPKNGFDIDYLTQYLENLSYDKYNSGTAQPKLNQEICRKIVIIHPSFSEQQKIAKILTTQDKVIELYEKKIEQLQLLKKICLRKMFPQEGSVVPEVRFPGYSEPWEQRKLGEVVRVYDGVHQTPDYQDHGIMFLSVENILSLKSEKYISEEAFIRDFNIYPEQGDVLMTRIGDIGTTNVVETSDKLAYYVSLALLKPMKIQSYFLSNVILSPLFQKKLKEHTLVTASPQKINKEEIGKVSMLMPIHSTEQNNIGAFFRNLDHLITLHQHRCDEEKRKKKALMQLLLTGIVRVEK